MKLTELLYPFAFLPVCLLLYYVLPKRCRNVILLAASLLFFAWGTPEYLVLLALAILLNYFAGLELESLLEDGKTGHARLVLVLTILADLLPLLFFKYYGEAAAALNRVFVLSLPVHALPAPVGVSFYTFTLLSALSDVYHGRAPMEKNLIRFALFVSFFPKLTSGPIVQYADMQPQLEPHEFVRERVGSGMRLFVIGLAKKVILAGLLGTPFYALKALGPQALSVCGAWLGALLYALMLYFDFSGYSDMAIGAAKMFGFEFLANFDYPYGADSVAAFWRRWHMSLGFWFRTYIYIPLGGSRCGTARTICNLIVRLHAQQKKLRHAHVTRRVIERAPRVLRRVEPVEAADHLAVGRLRLREVDALHHGGGHRVKRDSGSRAVPEQPEQAEADGDGRQPAPGAQKKPFTHRRSPPTTQRSDWRPSADRTPAADGSRPAARGRHSPR